MRDGDKPTLSFAAGYHLRAKPLCDGRVKLASFELKATAFEDDARGHEEFLAGRFDAGEFSLANYLALKSRGAPLMAIPVFPNRKFRHSYIFVCKDSPLQEPAQLKGGRVGIPSWLNTAGLWMRGILSDDYRVVAQDIHWIARRKTALDLACRPGYGWQLCRDRNLWRRAWSGASLTPSLFPTFLKRAAYAGCFRIPRP